MVMNLKYLLLSFLLVLNLSVLGQISSPADFSEATEYSDSDFVFVFCTELTDAGELIANDSTGFGAYDFEWFKFNVGTNDFTDVLTDFSINIDSTSSTISNLSNGGYKVVLTNADTIQEYVAWVYNNNDLNVEVSLHPDNDCDYLALLTEPYYYTTTYFDTPLTYYYPLTGTYYTLKNKLSSYAWTSNPEQDDFRSFNGPFTSIGEDPTDNESELPTENTIFSVLITDRFGCQAEDDIEYTAIETDADLSWTVVDDKTGIDGDSGSGDATITGSAPLMVRFKNESLNGQKYKWFFGDTLWNNDIDTLKTEDFLFEPEHTYYYTVADSGKTYTLRLYSESESGCRDSIFVDVKVEPSKIEFPNVFTPNGDDFNNVFIMKDDFKSIRSFKITIFNRVGQVVHEYEGDIRDWKGWKGDTKNGNKPAPEGNYFFVVEVTGWDNVNYNNKTLGKSTDSQPTEGADSESGGSRNFGVVRLFR
jgi:gliding motility-associated-like protein